MKKLYLGLFIAFATISASAFTNAMNNSSAKRFTVIYYQHANGTYTTVKPTGDCTVEDINPCFIQYVADPGVSSFTYPSRPLTTRSESADHGRGTN